MVHFRLDAVAVSDVGRHRAVNQDAAFTAPWGAAVADGVGGGPSGDLASAALVHRLVAGHGTLPDAIMLAEQLRLANWDLRAHVEREPSLRGMATTFTGLFASRDGGMLLAHTGDSRAYVLRGDTLARQTRDDSYVQALVDHGVIAPEEASTHPQRNIITASFAGAEGDSPGIAPVEVRAGDRWILCSDGLSDYVLDDEIARAVALPASPAAAAGSAVALALEAGTRDNVTVVVCDVEVGSAQSFSARPDAEFFGAAAARFTEGLETA